MKINSYKSDFKTYDTGKKIRTKYIPVIHALGSVGGFQNYTMKPYNNSPVNISLKEKIDRLPPLIKWIIDSTIRNNLATEYYTKENIIRTKEIILKSIDNFFKSPVKASSQFDPTNSANGQEVLMNLVGIQHGTYSSRDSIYFAGGYYFLAKFTSSSPYILSPIFSLMVESEYVTYLRYCQLFNLEIDNDIFEFWVDEKFDIQDTQYPTLRTCYRKSVKPVLKDNNITVVKKKDMFYEMYQCFKLPDFSTIEDMDSWKASKVDTFMSKFKKEIAGETVIFSEEDGSEYTMYLHECGPSKLQCVKFIKDFTTLGLRECKEIADNANGFGGIFLVTKTQEEVEAFIAQLNETGATASYRSGNQLQTPEYPATPEGAYSNEFSVGDYVVVLEDDEEDGFSEGTLCTISETDLNEDLQYELDYEGSTYWYSRDQIRKATQLEIDRGTSHIDEGGVTDVVSIVDRPFQVGDVVQLMGNTSSSRNRVGDSGVITEFNSRRSSVRVSVDGDNREGNWSYLSDLRLITPIEPIIHEEVDPDDLAELASIQSELTPISNEVLTGQSNIRGEIFPTRVLYSTPVITVQYTEPTLESPDGYVTTERSEGQPF